MVKCVMAAAALAATLGNSCQGASAMELTSPDVAPGASLAPAQVFSQCGGGNVAPALAWAGAPASAKSFAVTLFDPDAHGGQGWWHWIVYNLPATTHSLARGGALPQGADAGRNDFGRKEYDGACPPEGSGTHHYQFTVWAMPTATLDVGTNATGEAIEPYLKVHAIANATLTATYQR
ncbi:MAG TPA: YbhB/YbcL family Raf kinase inhibitor-like protein [Rhizomicrobium sp.]|nr:YbhB/YbcL family Raf kinase inhibitor-like protein [Rhizomicrobium sp.]